MYCSVATSVPRSGAVTGTGPAAPVAAHDDADAGEIMLEPTHPRVLCYLQHPPTTQRTPMTDADNTTSLQEQLAAHRATLAHLLTQRAYFDAGLVPSHVAHGIVEARREIARLKAGLRAAGVAVEDPGRR
jgi:hypothetical protein